MVIMLWLIGVLLRFYGVHSVQVLLVIVLYSELLSDVCELNKVSYLFLNLHFFPLLKNTGLNDKSEGQQNKSTE